MKLLLLAVLGCFVVSFGCKPVDHSKSEDKGLGSLLKKGLSKGGKLSDETLSNIKNLAKRSDVSDFEKEMRQILEKGGRKADEAVLAYTRAYDARLREWSDELSALRKKYSLSMRIELPKDEMIDLLVSIDTSFNRLSDILRDRVYQTERLVNRSDFTKTTTQMNDLALGGFGIGGKIGIKEDGSSLKLAFPEKDGLMANMRFLDTLKNTDELTQLRITERHIIETLSRQADVQAKVERRLKRLGKL